MAFGVYDAARELNFRIPDDLSVIGFDNIPEAGLVEPPLTTVDQSIERMGSIAAEVVIKLIAGQPPDQLVTKCRRTWSFASRAGPCLLLPVLASFHAS